MPFDPTLPATNLEMRSEEIRNQFKGLKDLIDENIPASGKGAADGAASLDGSSSSEQFGIGAGGQIRTNQSANATMPGSVVKKLPVFDSSCNSLGCIPIYDAIT